MPIYRELLIVFSVHPLYIFQLSVYEILCFVLHELFYNPSNYERMEGPREFKVGPGHAASMICIGGRHMLNMDSLSKNANVAQITLMQKCITRYPPCVS